MVFAPKKTTDKLQRVLNPAAHIVSNTRKYDRGLSQFRRHELHWLDADDRVRFESVYPGVQVSTQHGAWIPVDTLPTRVQRTWSSSPTLGSSWRTGLSTCQSGYVGAYGGRAFAYAGATSWSSLPDSLKYINLTLQTFKRHLKTFLFSTYYSARLRFLPNIGGALCSTPQSLAGAHY